MMSGFLDEMFWWRPFGVVPEIAASELERLISTGSEQPQLLDVRSGPEWQGGVIGGSVLLSVQHLKSQIDNLGFDKSKPVVAICRSAHRSIGAVRLLRAAGYDDASQLQGGMLAWEGQGFRVVKPGAE